MLTELFILEQFLEGKKKKRAVFVSMFSKQNILSISICFLYSVHLCNLLKSDTINAKRSKISVVSCNHEMLQFYFFIC